MTPSSMENWWKKADSDADGKEEVKAFRKLIDQFASRPDKAAQMETMLLEGRAPEWFVRHLTDLVMYSAYRPTPSWAIPWVVQQAGIDGSILQRHAKEVMFSEDMANGGTVPNWGRLWANTLEAEPDNVPQWFNMEMEDFVQTYGDIPYWANSWAKEKLRSGRDDDVKKELMWIARHDAAEGRGRIANWAFDWARTEGLLD